MADTETSLAFDHPSARAEATEGGTTCDRLLVRDHMVEVEIGAFQGERNLLQRVKFDVVVEVAPFTHDIDDDVDQIMSYDRVTEAIAAELDAERLNLLETLALRIADRILIEPQAQRVFVRIEKLDRGPGALGVEIVRTKADLTETQTNTRLAPRIVHLSNAAAEDPRLSDWLDTLIAREEPVILTCQATALPRPKVTSADHQRKIDLLAIEQNAWVLAARDPRLHVVATRTELDWAIKNGQPCVWAPSKLVLDATQAPESVVPEDLTVWFAEDMQACDVIAIGTALPENIAVSVRMLDPGAALF